MRVDNQDNWLPATSKYVCEPLAVTPKLTGVGPKARVEVRRGWETEATEVKVVTDYGCGAIEYRGGVTGAGV